MTSDKKCTEKIENNSDPSANLNESDDKTLATIKFRCAGKQYDFDTASLELALNDEVVVETNKGRALGKVVRAPRLVEKEHLPAELKQILRLATEADLNMARISASKEEEAYSYCLERINQRKMAMKLVKAEYLFDGSKIIFYFTADGRVDFRELVKDLAQYFHTRIEMRQIGVRDEAKLLGGIGICGRELCCSTFLTDFNPVSVRMAKQQGLALNPTKISGQCGRLLCCLGYEFDTYCKMAKQLPKQGSKLNIDGKTVEVLASQTLAQTVTVRCEGSVTTNVPIDKLKKGELQTKATSSKTIKAQLEQHSDSDKNKEKAKSSDKDKRSGNKGAGKNKKTTERRNQQPKRQPVEGDTKADNKNAGKEQQPSRRHPRHKKQTWNKQQGKQTGNKQAENANNLQQKSGKQEYEGQTKSDGNRPTKRNNRPSRRPNSDNNKTDNQTANTPTTNNQEKSSQPKPDKRRNRNRRRPTRKP
ncbi:MAG: hypothetical protein B6I36_07615 [Desulfobacteraceae bacterium 4572_35.1]|nr:MAG: hypothetical protein B6I36_07615 [Desulfobacteraceae bacterium 4572_35.1]